jgi:hypothetical protein
MGGVFSRDPEATEAPKPSKPSKPSKTSTKRSKNAVTLPSFAIGNNSNPFTLWAETTSTINLPPVDQSEVDTAPKAARKAGDGEIWMLALLSGALIVGVLACIACLNYCFTHFNSNASQRAEREILRTATGSGAGRGRKSAVRAKATIKTETSAPIKAPFRAKPIYQSIKIQNASNLKPTPSTMLQTLLSTDSKRSSAPLFIAKAKASF